MKFAVLLASAVVAMSASQASSADDEAAMKAMQEKLNAEVIAKPFTVADQAKVDAYINDAMQKNLKPRAQPTQHWAPGYTCHDLWRYSYYEYRDCAYYYRYYGRYW